MKPPAKFLPPPKLRKLRGTEQVAAVCYRLAEGDVQFLLVRTGGGRWSFPKGCAEPGLSHAQAAALEAFEEAGIHGRMDEASFARYIIRSGKKADGGGLAVNAYLCEVLRQITPEESKRKPTWFSAQDSKRRLREGRTSRDGAEFARVIEGAVLRIKDSSRHFPLHPQITRRDALQHVPFEASEVARIPSVQQAAFLSYLRHRVESTQARPTKRLALPSATGLARVVEIDKPRSQK